MGDYNETSVVVFSRGELLSLRRILPLLQDLIDSNLQERRERKEKKANPDEVDDITIDYLLTEMIWNDVHTIANKVNTAFDNINN